ncbi:hypothetical protein DMN91_002565 [Ooceraea biroi]|uniref:Uncharacterized protein n=1 Tax=Ooceraea biroi TaxID=2015173 RepID=A0A026WL05_OOCBI|nr:uncharacterized protein LOC105278112 [Ooceraea biroi]XP_011335252.1 uncharacterized protein LOC105278112 [Ooceraea biroi]XP_011335253.1 uncharacterized protein LOC105278112 [Ooceraea biroi]XP_011335254.1 uncharacterized protein LOC105278112 [Ooceraea biroi]XP_026824507.1 uncharacterized protein LOC105278112 [Ooceraea biroi]EZA56608.1 hypothetical protein X777_03286 [Ooceraea biroi]RLU24476.1 hypothetical protein DMN91_002565 [Ooceraea biroi]
MNARQAEFWLAILYTSSMVHSVTSIISLVTVWQHWTWTLDSCIDIDCGCILYGINTFRTFIGGDVKLCHFASYSLVPGIIISLCLGGYHGYRCCIHKNLDDPMRINREQAYHDDRNSFNDEVVVVMKKRSTFKQWMPVAFLTALICCLSLAHVVVITDGYYKTCEQYKRNLIQLLGSGGREVQAIHNRLPCGAIFDFMDYVQPDTNNWRRSSEINTGIALQLAIVTSWFNFFAWFAACTINIIMARRRL